MMLKRAPPVKIVLTFDDRKKVAALVSLLVTIDKRASVNKKEVKKSKTKLQCDIEARSICGPSSILNGISSVC